MVPDRGALTCLHVPPRSSVFPNMGQVEEKEDPWPEGNDVFRYAIARLFSLPLLRVGTVLARDPGVEVSRRPLVSANPVLLPRGSVALCPRENGVHARRSIVRERTFAGTS